MRYTAATCDPNDFKSEVRPHSSCTVLVLYHLTFPFYKGLYPPPGDVRARA